MTESNDRQLGIHLAAPHHEFLNRGRKCSVSQTIKRGLIGFLCRFLDKLFVGTKRIRTCVMKVANCRCFLLLARLA